MHVMQLSLSVPSPPAPSSSSLPPLSLFQLSSKPQHHVFFVHHPDQKDWVLGVIERLELQCEPGLRCVSLSQILETHRNISLYQAVNVSVHRLGYVPQSTFSVLYIVYIHLLKCNGSLHEFGTRQ